MNGQAQLLNICAWLFLCYEVEKMRKLREYIEQNMLMTEMILLAFPFVITLLAKALSYQQCMNVDWIKGVATWITKDLTAELLTVIDTFSIIFGIIIFFLDEWIKSDTENVVYLLVITIALTFTHIFKLMGYHYLTFFLCISIAILAMIPFWFMIQDNLRDSKRRTKKRNKS